jgi:DNA-directed RNA polymerase specialized sigma24 family protein
MLRRALTLEVAAATAFLTEMRLWLEKTAYDRYESLGDAVAQLIDDAEGLLHEWLCDPSRQERLLGSRTFGSLAWRLLAQVSKNQAREWEKDERVTAMSADDQEQQAEIVRPDFDVAALDAARVADRLPEPYRTALQVEAKRVLEGSPRPLASLLGVTAEAARKRLARATALLAAQLEEGEASHG